MQFNSLMYVLWINGSVAKNGNTYIFKYFENSKVDRHHHCGCSSVCDPHRHKSSHNGHSKQ